ncbi:hypothetical protein E2C01_003216 [Portunus trituberculatus]|uniref:Secreted protein n=1 Tax=Portunus trituberculatus TaxID=210409 RepID=A0A5B7CMC4_PORTR|nr:hypothetical protein [Portunus trituberculatus]
MGPHTSFLSLVLPPVGPAVLLAPEEACWALLFTLTADWLRERRGARVIHLLAHTPTGHRFPSLHCHNGNT